LVGFLVQPLVLFPLHFGFFVGAFVGALVGFLVQPLVLFPLHFGFFVGDFVGALVGDGESDGEDDGTLEDFENDGEEDEVGNGERLGVEPFGEEDRTAVDNRGRRMSEMMIFMVVVIVCFDVAAIILFYEL
jgi:hypothetical protein